MVSRILVSLRVGVSRQRAFDAFTGEMDRWWRPNPLFAFTPRSPGVLSLEPGEGGRLIETLPNGKVFEVGRVSVWAPPDRIVFSWRQATFRPGQVTEVEVSFEAAGDQTRVTVQHRGWESVPAEHLARHGLGDGDFLRRHGAWWRDLLQSLDASIRAQA